MIEEIEELNTKLHAKFFAESGVLDNRKISVTKTWSNNYVPAQASKARYRREHRRVKPFLDTADRCDRTIDVRAESVGDAIDSAVAGNDVDWAAALQLNDHSEPPTINEGIAAEWQVVNSVENEPVPRVKI